MERKNPIHPARQMGSTFYQQQNAFQEHLPFVATRHYALQN